MAQAVTFLPQVPHLSDAFSLPWISYIGAALAPVSDSTLKSTLEGLKSNLTGISIHLDVIHLTSLDGIVSLLDAGAAKAIVTLEQFKALAALGIEDDRFLLTTTGSDQEDFATTVKGKHLSLLAAHVRHVDLIEQWLKSEGSERPPFYVSLESASQEGILKVASLGAIPIVPVSAVTLKAEQGSDLIPISKILLASATSDRSDGLFTTLVTDERGTALGLVYSNAKSVEESLRLGRGVYQSRKRGLWYKGDSSGDIQVLKRVSLDCDSDCIRFVVEQKGNGFCHLGTASCFGHYSGLSRLQQTLTGRKANAPAGSYTARLFSDSALLKAKIMEEAGELCDATVKEDIAFEAADLFYFALTKCVAAGVTLEDVERNLDAKGLKVKRRKGDAKVPLPVETPLQAVRTTTNTDPEPASAPSKITMKRYNIATENPQTILSALQRPSQRSSDQIMSIVQPIIKDIQARGDKALLEYTHKFEKATSLTSPVLKAPFPPELMQLSPETIQAIDTSYENIRKFHAAQETETLNVETMPGVVCSRFSRPIERVGLYVPGGTAVLPSTALMLGVPAMVAGCKTIVLATPPRADGSLTPEIVYVAHKVGAESIVLAGGAQAVAALAYGTESVPKVDKILGPGNQFVTAAKMVVSNDTSANVAIDMPAGPSEVLVIADDTSVPAFVAADLLSQAEHGADSQVVLIAVGLSDDQVQTIENEVDRQANELPRKDIVAKAIEHSVTLLVKDVQEALHYSNIYAPEHLILQIKDAAHAVDLVQNAGSVFIGPWTPESVGDYSAGVNHSLRKCYISS
jgi:phosphoribosyl-ATP pyrophosphohydrolase/phosphoribosyl-AMP cyclohydrolase/histidinol dehydrogenase